MPKILLISGSPRCGNTEFILKEILKGLKTKTKELILLRQQKIKHCQGCLSCDQTKKCIIRDDMDYLYERMLWADIFVIGTSNYFDNVPGLLKDFIDRTNPFCETDKLKGKKLINIVVGGGETKNSSRVAKHALTYFAHGHKINIVASYFFQALRIGELKNNQQALKMIPKIIQKINVLV